MRVIKIKQTVLFFSVLILCAADRFVFANDNLFLHAVKNDDIELIAQLAKTDVDINLADPSGKTALMVAAKYGQHELVNLLLEKGAIADKKNNNGGSPLMFASINGDIKTINHLLAKNVDINARGSNGWGALMIACAKGHEQVVKLFLELGANVNTVDVYDWTPLHRASFENHEDVVELLLAVTQIKINARDDQGATALHHAANKGNYRISNLLIENGASPLAADLVGRTPANYAQQKGYSSLAQMLENSSS